MLPHLTQLTDAGGVAGVRGDSEKDVGTHVHVMLFTHKKSMTFPMLMFTKLTNVQQQCVQILLYLIIPKLGNKCGKY
jgi:hypothetical protein